MKEIIKAAFAVALNEMIRTGIGASHSKYQKFPFNPLEKYQHIPEKIIAAIAKIL
jgi:hypothetical protein